VARLFAYIAVVDVLGGRLVQELEVQNFATSSKRFF
jgi:hypothetical protein